MTVLPIITGQNQPVLRAKARPVDKVTKTTLRLIKDMQQTVAKANGLGLAAPQINESVRVCLAKFNGKMTPMVNPVILWRGEKNTAYEEGCLSLPDIYINVTRPDDIAVKYLDEKGKEQERKISGFDAHVVQHEVDHLEGVLIVDYDLNASAGNHEDALMA